MLSRPMAGAAEAVNKDMKESQTVAGFEYADFEASISKFDSSFQVLLLLFQTDSIQVREQKGAIHLPLTLFVAAGSHAVLVAYKACIGRVIQGHNLLGAARVGMQLKALLSTAFKGNVGWRGGSMRGLGCVGDVSRDVYMASRLATSLLVRLCSTSRLVLSSTSAANPLLFSPPLRLLCSALTISKTS